MNLGDRVTITAHLVRAELRPAQVLDLAALWGNVPDPILDSARKIVDGEGRRPLRYVPRDFRLWIPASLEGALGFDVRVLTRTHREPGHGSVPVPVAGIVTQRVQLQSGRVVYDYYAGATFIHAHTGTGYRVAYNVNRRPVLVHPSMIEGAP